MVRSLTARDGRLELRAEGRTPAALEKTDELAGPLDDAVGTPFAVVLGTTSRDPEMRRACEWRACQGLRASPGATGRRWSRGSSRTPEISDADAARYSLLLVGGPGENAVAKRLAGRIPLVVRPDAIVVDGKAFPATEAGVSLVYRSPLNPERYVAILAGTSPGGLWFAGVAGRRVGLPDRGRPQRRRRGPRPAGPVSRSEGGSPPGTSTAPGGSTRPSWCAATRRCGRRPRR